MKILVVGEINVDLILQGYQSFPQLGKEVLVDDCFLTLGSSSAICAVGLAKLGESVAFLGKVGCDTWGDFCLQRMSDVGIDVSRIIRDPSVKTGITASVTGPSDRALITHLGAIVALSASEVTDSALDGFDHLHISSYFMQSALRPGCADLFARASRKGLTSSLDPGFDPSERWERDLLETLRQVDYFFPNEVELAAITGKEDTCEALRCLQNGRTSVVAKLGKEGSITLKNGEYVKVPSMRVEPVDTTGAGDSFNAGFLHSRLSGATFETAMRFGAACGALSTLALGGTGSQPTHREAEEFMQSHNAGLESK